MSVIPILLVVGALLLAGPAVPCSLLEAAAGAVCTDEAPEDAAEEADAAPEDAAPDADCCAACLTCCARYVDAAPMPHAPRAVPAAAAAIAPVEAPDGAPLSIWRPPRA